MTKANKKERTERKVGKKGMIILGVILALVLLLMITVLAISNKNVKSMNQCVEGVLTELKQHYTLTPLDAGEYEKMKIYGIMNFDVEQYDIEGLGNLSIMRVNMGVMQMATAVITPKDLNMPLLSADYMYILGNRKSYLEFYDVVKEKDDTYQELLTALGNHLENYAHYDNLETSPVWYADLLSVAAYKSSKTKDDANLNQMLFDSLKIYTEYAKDLPALSEEEKAEKQAITLAYTDGLIEKGGISTDVFKNSLGDEVTKHFFDNVFFGTTRK